MSGKAKVLLAVALVCALLSSTAAVVLGILAFSGGKDTGEEGRVEREAQQAQEQGGQGGAEHVSPSAEKEARPGGSSMPTGQKPADGQSNDAVTTNYPDLVPAQIPTSSVEEYLLKQAAMDYAANTLGGSGAYQITQVRISAIDPSWGKVTFYRKDQDLTTETLFYKQGGNWAPAQIGPGTPAMPTDL